MALTVALIGYLLGCLNAAYYLVRWRQGRDIRETGSGNAGATNVGRILGPAGFVLVFLVDAGKGAASVAISRSLSTDPWVVMAGMCGVVAGHIWPVQLRFRGGKGIATLLGAWAVYNGWILLAALLSFLAVYPFLRRFVPSGLLAIAVAPFAMFVFSSGGWDRLGLPVLVGAVWMAHRDHLRLERGRHESTVHETTNEAGANAGGVS